jgi:uncharacterized protein (DUF3820 family)
MLEDQARAQGRSLANYLEWIARQHHPPGQLRAAAGSALAARLCLAGLQ